MEASTERIMGWYEIRPIKRKSVFSMNWCTSAFCHNTALYYLVHRSTDYRGKPSESRSRRCPECAKRDAVSFKIPLPEIDG